MIDSGINPGHPHVAPVAGGLGISASGEFGEDYIDRNGHGTAVAGVIREMAPESLIFSVKIFNERLTANALNMVKAIEWAIAKGMGIINLSLGTRNTGHLQKLSQAVELARQRNVAIVSAREVNGVEMLPGCLPDVISVLGNAEILRSTYKVDVIGGETVFVASEYPRDVPGLPRDQNFRGISFAVANMTGFLARAREASPNARVGELKQLLIDWVNGGPIVTNGTPAHRV